MSTTRPKFQRPLVLTGHSAAVYALCPWKDGFLSGDGNGQIVHWRHQASEEGRALAQIPDRVFCMQALPGDQLVVGTLSGDLFWLDLTKPKDLPKRWRFHTDGLFGLLHHGQYVFAIGGGGKLSKWDTKTGKLVEHNQIDSVRLRSIAFIAESNCLAIGAGTGDVHLVDLNSLSVIDTITQAHELTVFSILDAGDFMLTAGRDGQLRSWSTERPFRQLGHVAAHASTINGLAFRQNLRNGDPQACLLASAGRDREVRIWQPFKKDVEVELVLAKALTATRDGGHPASVNCCMWMDEALVTGGDDRTVRVWPLVEVRRS